MKKITTFCEYWRCPNRRTDVYLTGRKDGPYCSLVEGKRNCFSLDDDFPDWCPLESVE